MEKRIKTPQDLVWEACTFLRGKMEPSEYADYALVLLFFKFASDKAKANSGLLLFVPDGCSFYDVAKLKNNDAIAEKLNKSLAAIALSNKLEGTINYVDFTDESKFGKGKEQTATVTRLIDIFDYEPIDFGKILDWDWVGGVAEQLHWQSGKSKALYAWFNSIIEKQ